MMSILLVSNLFFTLTYPSANLTTTTYTTTAPISTTTFATTNVDTPAPTSYAPLNSGKLINEIGRYYIPNVDINACENIDIDVHTTQIFTANGYKLGIDVLKYSLNQNITSIMFTKHSFINLTNVVSMYFPNDASIIIGDIPSISVTKDGYLLVSLVPKMNAQYPGYLVFIKTMTLMVVNVIKLDSCYLPDHVSVSNTAGKIFICCEAEPDDFVEKPMYNPEGGVYILSYPMSNITDITKTFINLHEYDYLFNKSYKFGVNMAMGESSIYRTYINDSFSVNAEPEYSTVSDDDRLLFVGMQEVNAMLVISLETNKILGIFGLGFTSMNIKESMYNGFKSYSLDPSDKDGAILLKKYPHLYAMRAPDSIKYFSLNGKHYIALANEGDNHDFDESRVRDLTLDPNYYSGEDIASIQEKKNLGRLKVTNLKGVMSDITTYKDLYTFSSRDFAIFEYDESMNTLKEVYTSLNEFEVKTGEILGKPGFNSDLKDQPSFDGRSDDKGPEPEAIEYVKCKNGRSFVVIGMERVSGIFGYEVTDINNIQFVQYFNNRNFTIPVDTNVRPPIEAGDVGPENFHVVDDAYGSPILLVANTQSSSISVYRIDCDFGMYTMSPTSNPAIAPTEPSDNGGEDKKKKTYVELEVAFVIIAVIAVVVGIVVVIVKSKKKEEPTGNYAIMVTNEDRL